MNARIHSGRSGLRLWEACVKFGIDARKLILEACTMVRPFVPYTIDGRPSQDHPTEDIANDIRFFEFHPKDRWHAFSGLSTWRVSPGLSVMASGYLREADYASGNLAAMRGR